MKKILGIGIGVVLAVFLVTIVTIIFVIPKDYRVSSENSYVPYIGAVDIYSASREELAKLDLCEYSGAFGEVKNEEEAAQIAAKVVKEVYGNDESPYIVKFNENANAWIVHGSLPPFHLGGVASIAIDKDTGEILMMFHTK